MKKIKLYIAISLNGKIARANGSVDWLGQIPNPDKCDYGYQQFYDDVDTIIQGHNTYKQVLSFGIDYPYAGKQNYVLTRDQSLSSDEHVRFINKHHVPFIRELKEQPGSDIWLVGGAQLNTMFLNAGLIDEIILFVMPIIIPDGIDLFAGQPNQTLLAPIDIKHYPNGVVELRYHPEV
jgi:dihydrofolate reductase